MQYSAPEGLLKKGKVNDKEVNKIKWHRKLASDTTP
jgi:hypothetical protein